MAKSSAKKSGKQAKETKDVKEVEAVDEVVEISAEEEEESDNEDEGVDEAGMEKLLEVLGKDGLNDFDQAQLETLAGDEEDGGTGEDDDSEEDKEVEENAEDGEDEDNVALDEIDDELHPDTVPSRKIQIDNKIALERIRDTIKLDPSLPWTETLVISYAESISVDVDDDLNRELAFYKQALHGATTARSLASKYKLPFTRPSDYFAEMVKSDSHMERIRQRLLDESASVKKSEDKRKEREGKKYGKQVQIEKIKEREKAKKDMEERLKGLKRKRKGAMDNVQADGESFDIAVEDAISDRPSKRTKGSGASKLTRTARDSKFGFGGGGRRSKQNTRASTDNFDSKGPGKFGPGKKSFGKGAKGGKPVQRPGKSRRMAARTRS